MTHRVCWLQKRCKQCGETYPLDCFYRRPRAFDGRSTKCRYCLNPDARHHRPKPQDVPDGHKRCTACGETKPLAAFSKRKGSCRDCANASRRARRAALRPPRPPRVKKQRNYAYESWQCAVKQGKTALSFEAWREDIAERRARAEARRHERESERTAKRAWKWWVKEGAPDWWLRSYYRALGRPWHNRRLGPGERYALRYELDPAFRERERQRTRIYQYSNPQLPTQWRNTKRTLERWSRLAASSDGTVTRELLRELMEEPRCAWCLELFEPGDRQLDHITPLSDGGTHTEDNLTVACSTCNMLKGNKRLWQWLPLLEERMNEPDQLHGRVGK